MSRLTVHKDLRQSIPPPPQRRQPESFSLPINIGTNPLNCLNNYRTGKKHCISKGWFAYTSLHSLSRVGFQIPHWLCAPCVHYTSAHSRPEQVAQSILYGRARWLPTWSFLYGKYNVKCTSVLENSNSLSPNLMKRNGIGKTFLEHKNHDKLFVSPNFIKIVNCLQCLCCLSNLFRCFQ